MCLSVARAPARDDAWVWFSSAAAERADLTSDRLLPLVSAGNFDRWYYVAHDIGNATPLSEFRRVAELSTARSLALLLGIAHALDDAVSQGKPPYEVTPDSVFLDPRLGAMVGDLGVAREALGNPPPTTPHAPWVAPEVLRGEDAHPRSAVYSFGAIAYTLLTGKAPHSGDPQRHRRRGPAAPERGAARPAGDARHGVRRGDGARPAQALRDRRGGSPPAQPDHLRRAERAGAGGAAALPARLPGDQARSDPQHAPRLQTAVEEHPERGPALVALLCGGALLAGALAGIVAGRRGRRPGAAPARGRGRDERRAARRLAAAARRGRAARGRRHA